MKEKERCELCGDSGVTGECLVAMSGPTCFNPDCPPCQTPQPCSCRDLANLNPDKEQA